MRKSTSKSGTRKDYFLPLRSPAKRSFLCLIQDTPLWCVVMSTSLKNPEDQEDHEKGTLSDQPQLTCVTPTALLGSWGRQPIKDMPSLGTDIEMHAYWQGYAETHPRSANVVTNLLGDGDLDLVHHKVKAPAAKEYVARKTRTIASSKVRRTYWNRIKCKEPFWIFSRSCHRTSNNQPRFMSLEIPWGFLAWPVLCGLCWGIFPATKYKLEAYV
jgi:hypothetical protein